MISLLTVHEVAKILHYTPEHIAWLCRSGQLEAFKFGARWRIKQAAVQRLLEQGSNQQREGDDGRSKGSASDNSKQ